MCYTELVIPPGGYVCFSLNNTPLTSEIFKEICATTIIIIIFLFALI